MNTLIYRSGKYYRQPTDGGKVLMVHRQDPTEPQIGDQVAIGRYYATMYGGVTLDSSGIIIALNEPRG